MSLRRKEGSEQNSQPIGGQSRAATQAPLLCLRTIALPTGGCKGKNAARLNQQSLSEGSGKCSPGPGTELAALLKRTKAKKECARPEEPRGAAS